MKCLFDELSVLVIGDDKGKIYLFFYGIFFCVFFNIVDVLLKYFESEVISISVSYDLRVFLVVVKIFVLGFDK